MTASQKKKLERTLTRLQTLISKPLTGETLSELQKELKTLTTLQTASTQIPQRTQATLDALIETYTPNAPFKAVLSTPTEAYLVTTKEVPKDEPVIKQPLSTALLADLPEILVNGTKHLPLAQDDSLRLLLNLLYHASDPDSEYQTYIQALPPRFDNVLTYPSEKLLTLPKGLLRTALTITSTHVRKYIILARAFRGQPFGKVLSWENYVWACGVVMSRQNRLPGGLGLVPVWDMVEHCDDAESSVVVEEDDAGYVVLRGGFGLGEVVRMNYGKRGNEELLLYAGFVTKDNRSDFVELVVPVTGALAGVKKGCLKKLGYGVGEDGVVVRVGYDGLAGLLRVLRVAVMGKEGLVGVMKNGLADSGWEKEAREVGVAVVGELIGVYESWVCGGDERFRVLMDGMITLLKELLKGLKC